VPRALAVFGGPLPPHGGRAREDGSVWILAGVLAICFAVQLWRDPRTMRAGVFLTGSLLSAAAALLSQVLRDLELFAPITAGRVIVAGAIAVGAGGVVLGAVLVVSGLITVRREGFSVAHLLSLALGLTLLAGIAGWVWTLLTQATTAALILLAIMFPASYFGGGMVAYLLYGRLYRSIAPTMAPRPRAVVILGAGLAGGTRVTPLLAARLDRGIAVGASARLPLVVAGGRGPNETVSEARAMASYLRDHGVEANQILLEDHSRTTAQNLLFARTLLDDSGILGPVVAVSSNYHVFRTAMLMRQVGIDGYATGGKVARYYWPGAAIREFIAICVEHLRATVTGLALACAPVLAFVFFALVRL
jgi:uncharacterized SAM-binding protein YcdF (DUF218 family)